MNRAGAAAVIRFAVLGGMVLLGGGGAAAQTVPALREIRLIEGRGHLLRFQKDLNKVVVSEPKVADAVVIDPREVMVNAKGAGRTTLLVWETGEEPVQYEIEVAKDTSEWESFRKQIQDSAAGSPVDVTGSGDTIVLTGSVRSAEESKRLAGIAQTRAKTVINLLEAPPSAELRQILLQVKFAAVDRVALTQIGFNLFSANDKLLGGLSTQQFTPPRFSQLTQQNGQVTPTVNFSDLLNLFAFRPDLNMGVTIKALQEQVGEID